MHEFDRNHPSLIAIMKFHSQILTRNRDCSLEQNIGIIAACLPTIKPFFNPSIRWSLSKSGPRSKLTTTAGAGRHLDEDEFRLHKGPRTTATPLSIPPVSMAHAEITATNNRVSNNGCWISRIRGDDEVSLESLSGRTSQLGGITKTTEISCESRHDSRGGGWLDGSSDQEDRVGYYWN